MMRLLWLFLLVTLAEAWCGPVSSASYCFACDCGAHHPGQPVEGCECDCGAG